MKKYSINAVIKTKEVLWAKISKNSIKNTMIGEISPANPDDCYYIFYLHSLKSAWEGLNEGPKATKSVWDDIIFWADCEISYDHCQYFMVTTGDAKTIAGCVNIYYFDDEDHVARFDIIIDKKFRGKGIGKSTMLAAMRYLAERGDIRLCECLVRSDKEHARKMVEGVGMTYIKRHGPIKRNGADTDNFWLEYSKEVP